MVELLTHSVVALVITCYTKDLESEDMLNRVVAALIQVKLEWLLL